MKTTKYVEDIRKWWTVAHALEGESLREMLRKTKVRGTEWVKKPELFKDRYGLGMVPRMVLIRDFVRQGGHLKSFYNELYSLDKHKLLPGRHDFENAMRFNNIEGFPAKIHRPGVAELLCKLLNRAAPGRSGSIDASELFLRNFSGPRAIDNYIHWLGDGTRLHDAFLDGTELPVFVRDAERDTVMQRLRGLIAPGSKSSMVINLYQKSMWEGLRSIVPQIVAMRDRDDYRAILHIPLVSYSPDFIAPS